MALTPCTECGAQISTQATACPQCGAKRGRTRWWLWAPLGLLAASLAVAVVRDPSGQAMTTKEKDREEVIKCWNSIDPKSVSTEATRMAAAYCEGLEASFTTKYTHPPLPPRP